MILPIRPPRSTPHFLLLAAFFLTSAVSLTATPSRAQVRINEILPNPSGTDAGNEWVEIYNAGGSSVDLTGWAIDDAATIDETGVRAGIPEDLDPACSTDPVIGPGEYRIVKFATAVLNNTGDDVYLISDRLLNPTVVHLVTYPDAGSHPGESWTTVPDGGSSFGWGSTTNCATNGGGGDVTPPSTISDLTVSPGAYPGEMVLAWTAPGDDGMSGTASAYDIRVDSATITVGTFDSARDLRTLINIPAPQSGGASEEMVVFGLEPFETYYFAIVAIDDANNESGVSNSPGNQPEPGALLSPDLGKNHYYGNLHSHTGYSDGQSTPSGAYTYARSFAPTPLDYLAVTDHNHSGAGMNLPDYHTGLAQAASSNDDGNFVAIYGQEWGFASNGHVLIYEAPVLFGWEGGNYDVFVSEGDYSSLYSAVVANPSSYGALASFAHPQSGNFNSLAYDADGDSLMRLCALVNGPAFSTAVDESDIGNTGHDDEFRTLLDRGYRLGCAADQDNHNANWGASTESRSVVLADSLTKVEVLGAMAARRVYASQDHNVMVFFNADGHLMGEAFESLKGIRIACEVTDPDSGETVTQIELYRGVTGDGMEATIVATNINNNVFHWRELTDYSSGTEVHYFLKIRQGDNAAIWTSPIYVLYSDLALATKSDRAPAAEIELTQNVPNPFNPRTRIGYRVRGEGRVQLTIYDLLGRVVRRLVDGHHGPGEYDAVWDGRDESGHDAASGVYFYRLSMDGASQTKKLTLLR